MYRIAYNRYIQKNCLKKNKNRPRSGARFSCDLHYTILSFCVRLCWARSYGGRPGGTLLFGCKRPERRSWEAGADNGGLWKKKRPTMFCQKTNTIAENDRQIIIITMMIRLGAQTGWRDRTERAGSRPPCPHPNATFPRGPYLPVPVNMAENTITIHATTTGICVFR